MNKVFRSTIAIAAVLVSTSVTVASAFEPQTFDKSVKITLNHKDQEVGAMIESFAKASKKTFVVDPGVRGKVSVFAPEPVGLDEAFDLLSTSLALNGYAIIEHADRYVVMASRNAQRSSIPTLTEIKSVKPERYVTLIMTLNHIPVTEINKNLRILPSKDGEMMSLIESNQLLITDYISNVNRIAGIVKILDQPLPAGMTKVVKEGKARDAADRAAWQARQMKEVKELATEIKMEATQIKNAPTKTAPMKSN
jgi:general secretion pathway protein D